MITIRVTTVIVQYGGCLSCTAQVTWHNTATQLFPSIEIRPGILYLGMVVVGRSSGYLLACGSLTGGGCTEELPLLTGGGTWMFTSGSSNVRCEPTGGGRVSRSGFSTVAGRGDIEGSVQSNRPELIYKNSIYLFISVRM